MTATVIPPARSVASWAAPSMPKASPETTVASAAASASAIRPAVARPAAVARRVPTTAIARSRPSTACGPRTYRTCGGIAIAASRAGYAGSSTVITRTSRLRRRPMIRSASVAASTIVRATSSRIGRSRRRGSPVDGVSASRSTPAGPVATASTARAEPCSTSRAENPIGPRPCTDASTAHASRSGAYGSVSGIDPAAGHAPTPSTIRTPAPRPREGPRAGTTTPRRDARSPRPASRPGPRSSGRPA